MPCEHENNTYRIQVCFAITKICLVADKYLHKLQLEDHVNIDSKLYSVGMGGTSFGSNLSPK